MSIPGKCQNTESIQISKTSRSHKWQNIEQYKMSNMSKNRNIQKPTNGDIATIPTSWNLQNYETSGMRFLTCRHVLWNFQCPKWTVSRFLHVRVVASFNMLTFVYWWHLQMPNFRKLSKPRFFKMTNIWKHSISIVQRF